MTVETEHSQMATSHEKDGTPVSFLGRAPCLRQCWLLWGAFPESSPVLFPFCSDTDLISRIKY